MRTLDCCGQGRGRQASMMITGADADTRAVVIPTIADLVRYDGIVAIFDT